MKFHQRFGNYLQPFTNLVIKPLVWQENGVNVMALSEIENYHIYFIPHANRYRVYKSIEERDIPDDFYSITEAKQFAEEDYRNKIQSCLKWNFSFRDDVLMIWGCCAMILTFVLLTNIFAPSPRSEKKTISSEYNYRK